MAVRRGALNRVLGDGEADVASKSPTRKRCGKTDRELRVARNARRRRLYAARDRSGRFREPALDDPGGEWRRGESNAGCETGFSVGLDQRKFTGGENNRHVCAGFYCEQGCRCRGNERESGRAIDGEHAGSASGSVELGGDQREAVCSSSGGFGSEEPQPPSGIAGESCGADVSAGSDRTESGRHGEAARDDRREWKY